MKGDSQSSPLDLLIVGAGPAGTAAAWRAHELGLSVLAIDRESVLSILRDWAEQAPPKKVDADYGECADLPFPQGGKLVSQFAFQDQVLASELYPKWLEVWDSNKVPYRNGVEIGSCEAVGNGVLAAELIELATQTKSKVYTRNVLLALGSGSAAKVRLMGDGRGIRYKLGNVVDYVGAPACVIGGGMSAAEAVVTIAAAKSEAKDNSDVFWCYRGRSMPKVAQGKALAARFYESWMQGNIRYLPLSEPLAVFKDDAGKEFVAVKTRRVELPHQPPELVCYEFEKNKVLAFIGAERPIELLASMGIKEFAAADAPAKKRFAVTPLRETQVPGIYLGGSVLDPAFIETGDFRPDALQSTVKEHPGCFKTAIHDGVRAAETIHKRLRGGATDEAIRDQLAQQSQTLVATPRPTIATPKAEPEDTLEPATGALFVHIGPGEQATKTEHFFSVGDTVVGRTAGRVVIGGDALLLDQHAAFKVDAEECYVTNQPYGGECYVRFNSERTVPPGATIVAGRQRLRVDVEGGKLVLVRLDSRGNPSKKVPLGREERTLGRDDLDPRDFAMSRSHFSISEAGGVARLRDQSRNGTFLELRGTLRLNEGDEVWMGEQRFKFVEMRSDVVVGSSTASVQKAPAQAPASVEQTVAFRRPSTEVAPAQAKAPTPAAAPAATPAKAPGGAPTVVLPDGTAIPAGPDKPMLAWLAENGAATDDSSSIGGKVQTLWECWDQGEPCDSGGSCGKCVVTILEGMENLNEASSREKNTIKKSNKKLGGRLDEAKCRLACQSMLKGPVKIQPSGKTDG
ncbi:MAG: NAD(P)-binding domain-containing protein [Planctomycetes bacterium]|nr:NAD(P)-binding domain-containing protein [Planctomycetota bacterium]